MTRVITRAAAAAVAAVATAATVSVAGTAPAGAQGTDCPAVYALGVQGTGESSPDASRTTDTGMLSSVFMPLLAQAEAAGVRIEREYIPYEAAFGGAVPGGSVPYEDSVNGAIGALNTRIGEIAQQCPASGVALVGYSQGANAVANTAKAIGAGTGPIDPDQVVAVALMGDPTRAANSGPFPGDPNRTSPATVPGTSGEAVSALEQLMATTVTGSGSGIGPTSQRSGSYGRIAGRVASLCSPGDLACDAPDNAALLRAVANVAGQSELGGDPIRAISSIAESLAMTTIKTATKVVNEDISGNSLATLSLNPKKSLSERVAEASDPSAPFDPAQALQALFKVGGIALNAVVAVARTVLTPANIAEVAAAGMSNPAAGLAIAGGKLLGAVTQLVPPVTVNRLVNQTFQAVVDNVQDNSDLLDVSTWVKYSQTITSHGSYGNAPVTMNGSPATKFVANWITAAAQDVADGGGISVTSTHTPRDLVPTTVPSTATPTTRKPSATILPSTSSVYPTTQN
ncbi:cutinase family protein [Nocardia sp. NPDC058176]|uniref:cutinase family protein n=1 Tax=Nocardia sp. NPDC058176 TaxID=3346368 RepID=UPI0036DDE4EC